MSRLARRLVAAQGGFYLATGAWPLVHLRSFEAVTGPKVDDWLVQTVGALAIAIGAALLAGARREAPSAETLVLAGGAALAFAGVDLVFVLGGTIPPVYLADAAVELAFLAGVLWIARRPAS